MLTSPQNPRIKHLLRLRRGRSRRQYGQALIDAGRELLRALDAGVEVDTIFVCEALVQGEELRALQRARELGLEIQPISEALFEKIHYGERRSGLCAQIHWRAGQLHELDTSPEPLLLILENVEKPGNLGAIVRSADAAGVDAIILVDSRVDIGNPNALRASTGTIFQLPIVLATSDALGDWLAARDIRCMIATPEAERLYWETDLRGAIALFLGSEDRGVSAQWRERAAAGLRIPMAGVADSLNVSVAAALLLFEARRQRGTWSGRASGKD